MHDIVITAESVQPMNFSSTQDVPAGEEIGAGQAIYLKVIPAVDEETPQVVTWMRAKRNAVDIAARRASAISLHSAAEGDMLTGHNAGTIALGAELVPGTAYGLSDTLGGICPISDFGEGEYICQLGIAISPDVLDFDLQFPNGEAE